MAESIYELYGNLWANDDPGFEKAVGNSLHPRSPEVLYQMFGELGVRPENTILDIGCRDAGHSVELVRRFGCRAIAIDPIPHHIELAILEIEKSGYSDRITPTLGTIESLPLR